MIFTKSTKILVVIRDRPLKKGEYARTIILGHGDCRECLSQEVVFWPCNTCAWLPGNIGSVSSPLYDHYLKRLGETYSQPPSVEPEPTWEDIIIATHR